MQIGRKGFLETAVSRRAVDADLTDRAERLVA